MDLSARSEHLASIEDEAALELPVGGHTYRVRPPTVRDGLICSQVWAARRIEDRNERVQAELDALGGRTLASVTLRDDIVEQMTADGLPGMVVHELARVALVAWCVNVRAADLYVQRRIEQRTGGEATGKAPASGSRRRRKSGTSTASGRATRRPASTPTTGSRQN